MGSGMSKVQGDSGMVASMSSSSEPMDALPRSLNTAICTFPFPTPLWNSKHFKRIKKTSRDLFKSKV